MSMYGPFCANDGIVMLTKQFGKRGKVYLSVLKKYIVVAHETISVGD